MDDGIEEVYCLADPEATVCVCNPPCGVICAFSDCDELAMIMVPGELVFGFADGEIIDPIWGSPFDKLLSSGGWDTWVCANHGF